MNMSQDGRVFDELKPAIDDAGDFSQGLKRVVLPGFIQLSGQVFAAALTKDGQGALGIDMGIPDVEHGHFTVFPHPAAIEAPATSGRLFAIRLTKSIATAGNVKTSRQALQFPFPWVWQSFLKIIDFDHHVSLRTVVDAI